MKVKTDTKEKFVVFTLQEREISANMAENLAGKLISNAANVPPHLILNMSEVSRVDPDCLQKLAEVAVLYREKGLSMVVCCLGEQPAALARELDLDEILNIAPTESEAWDIVQMEEIERELLGGDNPEKDH